MTFIIYGKLPSLNEAFQAARGGTRGKYNREAQLREMSERYIKLCADKSIRGYHAEKPVVIHYRFYESTKRRDKDNIAGYAMKLIQDALVKGGYLDGDGWRHIENFDFQWNVDHKNPRIEVTIEERN